MRLGGVGKSLIEQQARLFQLFRQNFARDNSARTRPQAHPRVVQVDNA